MTIGSRKRRPHDKHNYSVATFTEGLLHVIAGRIDAAEHGSDPHQAAAWSKDAVTFWNRMVELHPELPELKTRAYAAAKADAEVAKWLSQSAPKKPASSQ